MSIDVVTFPVRDKRLGRQMVHDSRSRNFAMPRTVDRSSWRDKAIRLYDPLPNPNQPRGNCTGCASAMQFNAVGNRVTGHVLNMTDADLIYSLATSLDPWQGSWPPDDTGSSGLAAAKASQQIGYGGVYRFLFGGVDEVVQAVQDGDPVSIGTSWYSGMFDLRPGIWGYPRVVVGGSKVGGHQYLVRGYDVSSDWVLCRCWWGSHRDFWIERASLGALLADGGDAHVQERA